MPLVINSNISSLNSQRQLVKSGMELDEAMGRLSSGKRINSAADDAAGLAISNRQTSTILGLNRAVANANDGVSLIQTAEGALDESTNILQRIRELAIQSANGIYSDVDRATLDAESQQLKAEVQRIADTTAFNGQNVLDGSLGEVKLQVGSGANQTIDFSIGATDINSLGSGTGGDIVGTRMNLTDLALVGGAVVATGPGIEINSVAVGSFTAFTLTDTNASTGGLGDVLAQISERTNVTASAFVEVTGSIDGTGLLQGSDELTLTVTTLEGNANVYNITGTTSLAELAEKIGTTTGNQVTATVDENGRLQINSSNAGLLNVGGTGQLAATGIATSATAYTAQLALTADESGGEILVNFTATIDAAMANATDALGMSERLASGDIKQTLSTGAFVALTEGNLTINDVTIGTFSAATQVAASEAINRSSSETGVVATIVSELGASGVAFDTLVLNSVSGDEIAIDLGATLIGAELTQFGGT